MSNSFDQEWDAAECESIASLAQDVVLHVPGCADVEVRKAIQSAYADFCRLSACYASRHGIELEPLKCRYPIAAVAPGCYVDSVTDVRLGPCRLVGGRDYMVETAGVVSIILDGRLVPEERSGAWLFATAIDLPKRGSESVPQWFYDKYGAAVVAGALVRLFGMTGKPWSDAARAQQELIRWENYLTDARLRAVYADDRSRSGGGSLSALDTSGLL